MDSIEARDQTSGRPGLRERVVPDHEALLARLELDASETGSFFEAQAEPTVMGPGEPVGDPSFTLFQRYQPLRSQHHRHIAKAQIAVEIRLEGRLEVLPRQKRRP